MTAPASSAHQGAERQRLVLTREELERWGEAFGRDVPPSAVIALSGDLGAGKTTLAQAICRGFGVAARATSPTFALVHEYAGERGVVYHLDLYRLRGPSDLTNLAWDEIVNSGALVMVEWPERAEDRMPRAIAIHLAHDPDDADRRILEVGGAC